MCAAKLRGVPQRAVKIRLMSPRRRGLGLRSGAEHDELPTGAFTRAGGSMTVRRAAIAAALAMLAACGACVAPAARAAGRCGEHPWCSTALSADERAGLLLNALTSDEKVSLLGGDDLFGVGG